jgi:hypothetical protein
MTNWSGVARSFTFGIFPRRFSRLDPRLVQALLPDPSEVAVDKSTFGEGRRRQVDVTVSIRVSQSVCGSFLMSCRRLGSLGERVGAGVASWGASVVTRERIGPAGCCGFFLLIQPAIPCLVRWCGTRGRSAVQAASPQVLLLGAGVADVGARVACQTVRLR